MAYVYIIFNITDCCNRYSNAFNRTYLLKNDIKIVGIAIGFVGVIAAIIVFGIAMGSFTDYVAGELEFFYR